ncbi:MAG TPA: serine hydrolase domain-containing protein [Bacteroidales bacterium]|nr:serine hydrolase domain-containing protein [Bacteroidales bacterium]
MLRVLVIVGLISFLSWFSNNSSFNAPSIRAEAPSDLPEAKIPIFTVEDIRLFDERVTNLMTTTGFNGHVLVARNGNILFNRTMGYADLRNEIPLTHQTPFQLASITKTFTAAGVLILHQQEKLHIDSLVVHYINEFPYRNITVRHLLNHTSGIQNYMWVMERYWANSRMPSNQDMLNTFIRQRRPLDFTPGTRFSYSNTGYAMLALVIERVSGERFPDFMHDNIFAPLSMHDTFVFDAHDETAANTPRALGFRPVRGGHALIQQVSHDGVMGDKGIFSTAADLFKWDRAIAANQLLSTSLWEKAFEKTRLKNENTINYGLGWRLQTFLDQRIVHHPGRWSGFRTSFKRFIDSDATLIVLSNTSMNLSGLIENVQQILFQREFAQNPGIELPAEGEFDTASSAIN